MADKRIDEFSKIETHERPRQSVEDRENASKNNEKDIETGSKFELQNQDSIKGKFYNSPDCHIFYRCHSVI